MVNLAPDRNYEIIFKFAELISCVCAKHWQSFPHTRKCLIWLSSKQLTYLIWQRSYFHQKCISTFISPPRILTTSFTFVGMKADLISGSDLVAIWSVIWADWGLLLTTADMIASPLNFSLSEWHLSVHHMCPSTRTNHGVYWSCMRDLAPAATSWKSTTAATW